MASHHDDNSEWTKANIARPRPAAEVLPTAFVEAYWNRGRPKGSVKTDASSR